MVAFSDIISGITPTVTTLPLFHSCDIYSLRGILTSKKLVTQRCDVFTTEDLLYCFYGKPSYRSNLHESTNTLSNFPACFILNTSALPVPYKVYPFDTGAFVKLPELKKQYFHRHMEVTHFLVGNEIDDARALVEKIYSTNMNYYNAKPTLQQQNIPVMNLEAISYLNLISSTGQSKFDDRVGSIEVLFNENVELDLNTVENIVIPKIFLDDPVVNSIITDELNIANPIVYEIHRGDPIEYQALIISEVKSFLEKKSVI